MSWERKAKKYSGVNLVEDDNKSMKLRRNIEAIGGIL